jgi:hypothetical protein
LRTRGKHRIYGFKSEKERKRLKLARAVFSTLHGLPNGKAVAADAPGNEQQCSADQQFSMIRAAQNLD